MAPRTVRTSTWVGLIAFTFWGMAIPWAIHSQFGGDARALLRLGDAFRHPPELAGAPLFPGDGYDGQFFAALATDPLLLRPATPLYFDAPAYRAGRIGLPLLAWVLAAGNGRLAILVYQILSWILGVLIVWTTARWLEDEGQSAWWAAPLIVTGGLLSSFFGSMPDPAALSLAVLALWLNATRRRGVVPLLVAAVLIRDTMVIPALAVALEAARDRKFGLAARAIGAPVVALVAWRAYVVSRGLSGMDVPGGNFALPLTWLPEKLAQSFDGPEVMALTGAALAVAGGVLLLPRIARWTALEASYAGFVVMALSLSRLNYIVVWWGYARSLLPLAVLSVLVAGRMGPGWRRAWFHVVALTWAAVGAVVLPRWAGGLALALLCVAMVQRVVRRRDPPAEA